MRFWEAVFRRIIYFAFFDDGKNDNRICFWTIKDSRFKSDSFLDQVKRSYRASD